MVTRRQLSTSTLSTRTLRSFLARSARSPEAQKPSGIDCGRQTEFQRTSTAGRRETC